MNQSFDKIDFNLLRTLYVLLEEGSVTRAAERLFLTQSAMSKALSRLRDVFDDPLMVRHGSSMVPTPLAEQLRAPLQEIMTKAQSCFDLKSFDPALSVGKIRIAAPEQFAVLVVPELLAQFSDKAPSLSLEAQHLSDDFAEQLAIGAADFAVVRSAIDSVEFTSKVIYTARPVCWCRKGHPLLDMERVSLADICAYPLIRMKTHFLPEDIKWAQRETAAAGLRTRLVLETEHMVVAMVSLVRSNTLMIAPDFLSVPSIDQDTLTTIPITHIPVFARMQTNLHLVQHRRTANSLLHQWVAKEIVAMFNHAVAKE